MDEKDEKKLLEIVKKSFNRVKEDMAKFDERLTALEKEKND